MGVYSPITCVDAITPPATWTRPRMKGVIEGSDKGEVPPLLGLHTVAVQSSREENPRREKKRKKIDKVVGYLQRGFAPARHILDWSSTAPPSSASSSWRQAVVILLGDAGLGLPD